MQYADHNLVFFVGYRFTDQHVMEDPCRLPDSEVYSTVTEACNQVYISQE